MRVSSLVGAAEAPPAGSDIGRGRRPRRPAPPARPPSHLPLTSLSPPSHLPLASKNIKRERKPVSGSSRAHILRWLNLLAPNRSVAQALRFRVSITPAHERSPGVRCIRAALGAGRPHGSPTLVGSGAQWPRCDAQWPRRGAQWNGSDIGRGARPARPPEPTR